MYEPLGQFVAVVDADGVCVGVPDFVAEAVLDAVFVTEAVLVAVLVTELVMLWDAVLELVVLGVGVLDGETVTDGVGDAPVASLHINQQYDQDGSYSAQDQGQWGTRSRRSFAHLQERKRKHPTPSSLCTLSHT